MLSGQLTDPTKHLILIIVIRALDRAREASKPSAAEVFSQRHYVNVMRENAHDTKCFGYILSVVILERYIVYFTIERRGFERSRGRLRSREIV